MAMSRSIGASSLTTLPSIEISPELIASSPAIIRSVVVLPQPDGPTNTTNSLSRIWRLTSLTACTLSKNLLSPLRTTCPIRSHLPPNGLCAFCMRAFQPRLTRVLSALHRSGQSCDVVLDEKRIGDSNRDRSKQGASHQRSPVEYIAADQLRCDADRHGLLLRRGQEDKCIDELVPRQRESEDAGREDARDSHRDDDVEHGLPARGAVNARAFLELLGHCLEVAHHEPGAERNKKGRIGQNQ